MRMIITQSNDKYKESKKNNIISIFKVTSVVRILFFLDLIRVGINFVMQAIRAPSFKIN